MSIYLSAVADSRELEGIAMDKAITNMAICLTQIRKALNNNSDNSVDLRHHSG